MVYIYKKRININEKKKKEKRKRKTIIIKKEQLHQSDESNDGK